jgi:hypothetical protein
MPLCFSWIKIYKTVTLRVLFMGVKLSLTLREEHGLRVSENCVLRRIFGQEAGEECITLMYASPNNIR